MCASSIAEMKSEIRNKYETRIEALRQEMESILASLSTAEETLGETHSLLRSASHQGSIVKKTRASDGKNRTPSAKSRILALKDSKHGRFLRMELYDEVNNDGYGEIPIGTFSLPFSQLTKCGEIIAVEKGFGNTPSTYMWKEEFAKEAFSTTNESNLL